MPPSKDISKVWTRPEGSAWSVLVDFESGERASFLLVPVADFLDAKYEQVHAALAQLAKRMEK